ncbi:MAG: hypothetical protein ABEJ36_06435 [Candidatus Nanosalina sp.]
MEITPYIVNQTKYSVLILLGTLFAFAGAMTIIFSGENLPSMTVGALFFLIGAAVVIFSERASGV